MPRKILFFLGFFLVSCVENLVHMQIFDMLQDANRSKPLPLHEDVTHNVYVDGLTEFLVKDASDCLGNFNY